VFDKQDALPKEVYEAAVAGSLLDGLLEGRDARAIDTKHVKKAVPKRLRSGIFRRLAFPLFGKGKRAVTDFV
jgi:hypothetical protein